MNSDVPLLSFDPSANGVSYASVLHGVSFGPKSEAQQRKVERDIINSMDGKYTIELCRPGGEGAGIERVFERQDDLALARKLYRTIATEYPDRVVMLCDRAHVLARSDRPETMPQ